jgi:hypothetical protein
MFMLKATEGRSSQDFPIPPGVEFIVVDAWTGIPPSPITPVVEPVRVALLPEQFEALRHKGSLEQTDTPVPDFDPLEF